jgi:hypothetical protein
MRGNTNNRTITVNREDLLSRLRDNKIAHAAEYAVSMKGWQVEVREALEEVAAECTRLLTSGNFARTTDAVFERPEKPQDWSGEYTKAIRMFEVEVDKTIELEGDEINAYIHDEWTWSNHAKHLNRGYTMSAARY